MTGNRDLLFRSFACSLFCDFRIELLVKTIFLQTIFLLSALMFFLYLPAQMSLELSTEWAKEKAKEREKRFLFHYFDSPDQLEKPRITSTLLQLWIQFSAVISRHQAGTGWYGLIMCAQAQPPRQMQLRQIWRSIIWKMLTKSFVKYFWTKWTNICWKCFFLVFIEQIALKQKPSNFAKRQRIIARMNSILVWSYCSFNFSIDNIMNEQRACELWK